MECELHLNKVLTKEKETENVSNLVFSVAVNSSQLFKWAI